MPASEADRSRMIERHRLVVNIIDINSQQLRCESAKAGVDIQRACALRDAAAAGASEDGKVLVASLDQRLAALVAEAHRLETQREFLNVSLAEFDANTVRLGADDVAVAGRA